MRERALRHAALELGDVASGAQHGRSQGGGQLGGGSADAASGRVHQHRLARAQRSLQHQRVEGGDERLGNRRRLGIRKPAGNGQGLALVGDQSLGEGAAAHQPHHPVARLEAGGARADGQDDAGVLEAGDVGAHAGGCGVEPEALQQVGAVRRGGVNLHQDFFRTRHGVRHVLEREGLEAARRGDSSRFHVAGSSTGVARSAVSAPC